MLERGLQFTERPFAYAQRRLIRPFISAEIHLAKQPDGAGTKAVGFAKGSSRDHDA
jgi:hypothetical protein